MTRESRGQRDICFAKEYNIYKLIWIFLIGSFAGDIIETIFCYFTMGRWMSRSSVIYGPFSVVWGIGALLLTVTLHKLAGKRDMYIFFFGTIIGGVYEYLCSLITELLFGASFWDYSGIAFNINGRVNLLYCFFWGIIALVWVKDIYPRLSGLIERILNKIGKTSTWLLTVFMIFNMAISAFALVRAMERKYQIPAENKIEVFLDKYYTDERIMQVYPKIKFIEK